MRNLSYWERNIWLSHIDFCVVGSGIVGLTCALHLKLNYPEAKVLVVERGILPQGASTKNAGFACFGSVSELLSDLKQHSEEEVVSLVHQRKKGLELLTATLGKKSMQYAQNGGFEIFLDNNEAAYLRCMEQIPYLNNLLFPLFKQNVFQPKKNDFSFKNTFPNMIFNPFEGQIHTGKMMLALLKKVQSLGVLILNATEVKSFVSKHKSVHIQLINSSFSAKALFIANNAFAAELLNLDITPARNQVLVTQPIEHLPIKGTFHLDEGYYYFRNIDNRILLGGGRNLALKEETTSRLHTTPTIQNALENLLKTVILPHKPIEIAQRWSGILGIGEQKKPIVKPVSNNVYCGVRLGGMGVAIGSLVGKKLADLIK